MEFDKDMKLPRGYSSKMIFSDFKLFYQTIYPGDENSPLKASINDTKVLNLKYNQNIFSLQVSSINYDYPSNILYSWRLEGFYDEWSKPGTENTIRYTNLTPGTYTLRVRPFPMKTNASCLKKEVWICHSPAFLVDILGCIGLYSFPLSHCNRSIAYPDFKKAA